MDWREGNPPKGIEAAGMYFVRELIPDIGFPDISYKTMCWSGFHWRQQHPSNKVTHYCPINEPVKLGEDERYADLLGRIECVAQGEVLPDVQTSPGQLSEKRYTIVYQESWMVGSHRQTITRSERVETSDIAETIKKIDIIPCMIFEGWPKLEGEDEPT